MQRLYEITQQVLDGTVSIQEGLIEVKAIYQKNAVKERSRSSCILRLFRSLSDLNDSNLKASIQDVASHLRQFILTFQKKIYINRELAEKLTSVSLDFGLSIDIDLEVTVTNHYPDWFVYGEQVHDVYRLSSRRCQTPVIADGLLREMTGYTYYQSVEQKELVQASINLQPGETLLACLPTGGGKSLLSLLPSYIETQGGTLQGNILDDIGTTIVVVPTVALALDQRNAAQVYFSDAPDEKYLPQAYRHDMTNEEKQMVLEGLKEGTLPILFTNPESIVSGILSERILQSAERGNITRFVIDEAHIVVDWGNQFRTDYQLLSPYWKKLFAASGEKLKTILMSATLTNWTTSILKKLFSVEGRYTEIRCDGLRYEPIYMLDKSQNENERYNKIVNLLSFLPRPIILYVNAKEHANSWKQRIEAVGYRSVSIFTADESDAQRQRLLEEWGRNKIDIMVATTAFGMGVDKSDVRTVIHCCLPESMNRYYQEVGRGGRDGFASISLLSYTRSDVDIARGFFNKEILTTEILVERWDALFKSAISTEHADQFTVITHTQPERLKHRPSGKLNEKWNESTLLLLYRNNIIDLLDVNTEKNDNGEVAEYIKIQILDFSVINDNQALAIRMKPDREAERSYLESEFALIQSYVESPLAQCISGHFEQTYPYAEPVCGGCPYCHHHHLPLRYHPTKAVVPHHSRKLAPIKELGESLRLYFVAYRDLLMTMSDKERAEVEQWGTYFSALIETNVRHLIVPELTNEQWQKIVGSCPGVRRMKVYSILQFHELQSYYANCMHGAIAIVYPMDEQQCERVYHWSRNYVQRAEDNVVIHLTAPDMYIPFEGKVIEDLLDASSITLERFIKKQQRATTFSLI